MPGVLVLLTFMLAVSGAVAYFTAAGAGTSAASVATLSAPGSPSAAGAGTAVSVTWTAATINGSVAATSYTVERYTSGGADMGAASCSPVSASTGIPDALGSFSCTDSPAPGSYKYTITGHYGSAWTAVTGFTGAATAKAPTSLTASAPAAGTTGSAIASSSLTSTLSGATAGATGTVTFTVFGPQASAPTNCSTGGTTVGTATVSGNNTYQSSASFTPGQAGTYWWYASYGGDANNTSSNSTCGGGMASTTVKNAPSATASAPATGTAGTSIAAASISSALSGATSGATGTITFTVFGPQASAPAICSTGGTTVGTAAVSGNNTYQSSASFTPAQAGNYWWYASYNGDANNNTAASTCGAAMSKTVVAKASPAATATGPANATAGTSIAAASISSALSGATSGATGTITFTVFGPQASAPAICSTGGTTVGTAAVSGNNTYQSSASFTPAQAGNYWWYASYNGDANNNTAASTCGATMSKTVVAKASPTLTAAGPATGTTNVAITAASITSVLSNGSGATGTVTFKVFGPQASAPTICTAGTTVGTATVSGNNTYVSSGGYTPSAAGTYWWYASYAGDTNNNAATSTCGAGMGSTVVKNATAVTATAPASGTLGSTIATTSISSVLSGAIATATGTITFTVIGPQASAPTTCPGGGSTVGTATVSGNNTYHPSAGWTPTVAGTYWWYAGYNGDTSDFGSTSTCGTGMGSTSVPKATTALTASGPANAAHGVAIPATSISSALSGAYTGATGTITIKVFGPQGTAPTTCTAGTTVGTATVSGNGTYHPSGSYTAPSTGTYWWYASYNGDTSNSASNSTCGTGMGSTNAF